MCERSAVFQARLRRVPGRCRRGSPAPHGESRLPPPAARRAAGAAAFVADSTARCVSRRCRMWTGQDGCYPGRRRAWAAGDARAAARSAASTAHCVPRLCPAAKPGRCASLERAAAAPALRAAYASAGAAGGVPPGTRRAVAEHDLRMFICAAPMPIS
jgi:hypothetical protein